MDISDGLLINKELTLPYCNISNENLVYTGMSMNGKGDNPRKIDDREEYDKNWNAIFGDKRVHKCYQFVRIPGREGRFCYWCGEEEEPF
jgi:hypothetical protein